MPFILPLESTNAEIGKQLLTDSGLNLIKADELAEAAHKAVEAVQGE